MRTIFYRKDFGFPMPKKKRYILRFGSANYQATVWVNGNKVGEHEGGYLPVEFDVTKSLHANNKNTAIVKVNNELTPHNVPPGNLKPEHGGTYAKDQYPAVHFDFFPYGGLDRPAKLYVVPEINLKDVTVVSNLYDDYKKAILSIEGETHGEADEVNILLNDEGKAIIKAEGQKFKTK